MSASWAESSASASTGVGVEVGMDRITLRAHTDVGLRITRAVEPIVVVVIEVLIVGEVAAFGIRRHFGKMLRGAFEHQAYIYWGWRGGASTSLAISD